MSIFQKGFYVTHVDFPVRGVVKCLDSMYSALLHMGQEDRALTPQRANNNISEDKKLDTGRGCFMGK